MIENLGAEAFDFDSHESSRESMEDGEFVSKSWAVEQKSFIEKV